MPVKMDHPLASSLTTLPGVTNMSCPICLESNVPFLKLSCIHHVCVPCGSKADKVGIGTCPQCRAPAVLDIEKILSAFEAQRAGYASWRNGNSHGARGELSDIRLPAQLTLTKGVIHHARSGMLFTASKEQKSLGPLKVQTPNPVSPPSIVKKHVQATPLHWALLGQPSDQEPSSAIVFLWLPRSTMWNAYRVEERAQRALSAVRAGQDLVCLPNLPSTRELFTAWCEMYGICSWQAIFFDPLLPIEEGGTLTADELKACPDRSMTTLESVLKTLTACYPDAATRSLLHIYHSNLSENLRDRIVQAGIGCLGDTDEHPLIGSLAQAKGWIHADYCVASGRPSLSASLRSGEIHCQSLHTPRGFVCHSAAEQRAAFRELKNGDASTAVVLKPTDGLGCAGLVLDATEADLDPSDVASYLSGECWTVEEMVGIKGAVSPTVYMIGSTPIAIADQLMEGTCNKGNITPSSVDIALQQAMTEAGKAIGRHLGLRGQWGLDFAIDEAKQTPVIVDLNMGRPNGSLSFYMWNSMQSWKPSGMAHYAWGGADVQPAQLHQIVISRSGPPGETVHSLIEMLQKHSLLWEAGCSEGILPVQYILEGSSSLLCASWFGRDAALALIKKMQNVDQQGTYRFVVR